MDAQQFLAEFGHIANAPGGVDQLRKLILRYAISGRLVENNENEDIEDYFQAIQEDMAKEAISRNIKVRNYSGQHSFAFPLSIPKSWKLVNLSEFALINMGQSPKSESVSEISKTGLPFFQGKSEFGSLHPTPRKWCSEPKKIAVSNDILLSVRAPVGPTNLAVENTCIGRGLTGITALGGTNYNYLLYVFRALEEIISAQGVGTTFIAISLKDVQAIPIPVPPLEEQSRIVAKVDELMALCDQLEAQQQQRRTLQNHLRQATLQAVAASQSPHELQDSWQRLQANFSQLFSAPEDVVQLRALILDLAVHGLLVERSSEDAPISDWLNTITATKASLAKQKLISKQTAFSEIPEEGYPFTLPNGWAFVRLGQITNKIGSGSTPRGGREVYVNEGIPFLRSQNIWNDGLRMDDVACIPAEVHERMSRTAVAANDVLLNITGASLGRCALVPPDFGEANVSQHVTIIRLTDTEVREYIHLCILSPYTQTMIWGRQVGMAREGLSKKVLEQFEIPLPPIAEQKRIVARVGELMKFCDTLESKLHRTLVVSAHLATASVATLTGIAIEQEEEPMKVPQTELVAPVRLGTPPDVKAQAPLATILARHNGEMSAKGLWQRFGGEIDAFYAQLKTEVAHGWLLEPEVAEMHEKASS